jgi:hypothetical protein
MQRVIAAIFVVACQSSNPSPTPNQKPAPSTSTSTSTSTTGSPNCATVGEGIKAIWDKQVADADSDQTRKAAEEMREKVVARLVRHCKEDGWSEEAIQCVRGGQLCPGKLTPEQKQKLEADDLNKEPH